MEMYWLIKLLINGQLIGEYNELTLTLYQYLMYIKCEIAAPVAMALLISYNHCNTIMDKLNQQTM